MTTDQAPTPIDRCLTDWHRHLRGELPGGLDALLHDDVVFLSPVVFTPQVGRDVTTRYLTAAANTFGGETEPGRDGGPDGASPTSGAGDGGFRYVRILREGNHACLEFETTMDGTYVNGVDLITCDDEGRIVEFKVMVRPLKAMNAVHAQMRAMLEAMTRGDPS